MKKTLDFASQKKPLDIFSVVVPDNIKDYIYVEAYKKAHVEKVNLSSKWSLKTNFYSLLTIDFI